MFIVVCRSVRMRKKVLNLEPFRALHPGSGCRNDLIWEIVSQVASQILGVI